MEKFDEALENFSRACIRAANWKDYWGACYRTRLEIVFADVRAAYEAACRADDEERGE